LVKRGVDVVASAVQYEAHAVSRGNDRASSIRSEATMRKRGVTA
jgi:hypothetical protein